MKIAVAGHKGGMGKTTTAFHLAAYLGCFARTVLVDRDPVRGATRWCRRNGGAGLFLQVVTDPRMAGDGRDGHVVVDTRGGPGEDDFEDCVGGCDLVVIPAVPETMATDGLVHTLLRLRRFGAPPHRVLLTMVPPWPRTGGQRLREELTSRGVPVFKAEIPRLAAFEKAAAAGVAVHDVRDDRNAARAWDAYASAAREIHP